MSLHILKCTKCGKYTLKEKCDCGADTVQPMPAKYSPEDTYGRYRRETKKQMLVEKGLI